MNTNPIIVHIDKMLAQLEAEQLRAVYMVVKQIYDLRRTPLGKA